MSNDNFYSEDNDPHSEEFSSQPQQGMSKGVKVLLILLGVGGVCMLLCCGGLFYAAKKMDFKMKVTEKKTEIIEIQKEIAEITIPDTFTPHAGMSMSVVGVNMRMAIYEQNTKEGAIVLMSLGIPDDGMVDLEKEFQKSMKQQNQNQRELNITKEEKREFTIKGKKVSFNFAEGTDEDGTAFNQVTGVFPGNNGPAFLMVQVASDDYNEDEIIKMIESIK